MAAAFLLGLRGRGSQGPAPEESAGTVPTVRSPFSLQAAIRFGAIFLALQVAGTLAERALGEAGFYAVSALGGLVSSASAVASAANLASTGTLSPMVAGVGAIVASLASALVNLPIVSRVARDRRLTRRVAVVIGGLLLVAALGVGAQLLMAEMRR
jgi:uncharacterized membrane protein (DUF4010 family)